MCVQCVVLCCAALRGEGETRLPNLDADGQMMADQSKDGREHGSSSFSGFSETALLLLGRPLKFVNAYERRCSVALNEYAPRLIRR